MDPVPPPGPAAGPTPSKPEVGPPDASRPLGLFEGFGVEMEWMIVDARSLDVRPVGDALLGEEGEVDRGAMAWSNELVLHVLEVKTNGPAAGLDGLSEAFHAEALEAERRLAPLDCRLLGGAAHPWMDPHRETRIWPHEYTEVYRAFDRIFGVRGHGWANLQSTHLNLPFVGDREFAALHRAIRLVLPLLPGLAAASPVLDGVVQPNLDERMERYRTNALRVPSVSGGVIPEPVGSRAEYEEQILGPVYRDLEPLDPEGTLRHEWVNARGAIPRFTRGAIEIRVLDAQESPAMDLLVLTLTVAAVRRLAEAALSEGEEAGLSPLDRPDTAALRRLLAEAVREGERAPIGGARAGASRREVLAPVLEGLGVDHLHPRDLGELWGCVAETAGVWSPGLGRFLAGGTLARRLLAHLGRRAGSGRELRPGDAPGRSALQATWEGMADALRRNGAFEG